MHTFSFKGWHLLWVLLLLVTAMMAEVLSSASAHAQALSAHRQTLPAVGVRIIEFALPTANAEPDQIIKGPDSNFWFTEVGANQIGRITPTGVIKEFPVPTAGSFPEGITKGPDGALWFTEFVGNKIGRISTTGKIKEFVLPTANADPLVITKGPDGALWFTEQGGNKIGRITTAGVIREFVIRTANSSPSGITSGPDGALWFTEQATGKIGRITTAGVITEPRSLGTNAFPVGIVSGPGQQVSVVLNGTDEIARVPMDSAKSARIFFMPSVGSNAAFIAHSGGGSMAFTETDNNQIGRINLDGSIQEFPIPTPDANPVGIANAGSPGNVLDTEVVFTELLGNKIGFLTVI